MRVSRTPLSTPTGEKQLDVSLMDLALPLKLSTSPKVALGGSPQIPAWTFPVRVLEGELLSSWLCRSAHRHGVGPYAFLSLRLPGAAVWNRDVDANAPADLLSAIDRAADLPPGTARRAALGSWFTDSPVADPPEPGTSAPAHRSHLLAAGIRHRTRTLHGLQFCPTCLSEDDEAFYRRRWRLAFVVGCPRHDAPLLDACQTCDAPIIPNRAAVGRLASCHACGTDLRRSGPRDRHPGLSAAMGLQRFCMRAIERPDAWCGEVSCSGRDALRIVRALVGASAPPPIQEVLRESLGCPGPGPGPGRRYLERMRVADRIAVMQMLALWMAEGPGRIAAVAGEVGLSQRSFSRLRVPPALTTVVGSLEEGATRRRPPWRPILGDADMRRLRQRDPSAYRVARARRILAGAAVPV